MSGAAFFGDFLVSEGHVSAEALADAVAHQQAVNLPLGALALARGLLTEAQVLRIHTEQRRRDLRFGELAVELGLLSPARLEELLREQQEGRVLLGEALVRRGHLDPARLEAAVAAFARAQREQDQAVRARLAGSFDPELIELAAGVTCRMLLRLTGQPAKVWEVTPATEVLPRSWWFQQDVQGEVPFALALTFGTEELLFATGRMLESVLAPGDPRPAGVDDLVLDTGKELTNIIMGHVCAHLSGPPRQARTAPRPPVALRRAEVGPFAPAAHVDIRFPEGSVGLALRPL